VVLEVGSKLEQVGNCYYKTRVVDVSPNNQHPKMLRSRKHNPMLLVPSLLLK